MTQAGRLCVRCCKEVARQTDTGVPTCENCEKLLEASLQAMSENARSCPVHSVGMTKEIILNIVVDRCPACHGIWLDGGELDLLKTAIKSGMPDDFARAMLLPW